MTPGPDDDDDLALPPLPPLGEDEEVGIGEDLGEETDFADADETVGLDDSEGIEDDFDPVSLLHLDDLGAETGLDNENAGDMVGELGSEVEGGGDEYGWTQDSEKLAPEDWDDTPLIEELHDLGDDFGGALGLDDNPLVEFEGEDDPVGLPPLNRDEEEGYADDLDLEEDGQIELPPLTFEQEVRLMGSQLPPPITTPADVVMRGPVYALARGSRGVWAAGDDLRCASDEGVWTAAAEGLEPEDLISVAASGRTVVVGTQLGGVFRSEDDGETFHPINGWRSGREPSVGCRVAFDRAGRLWMWAGGALYRSRDLGNRWTGPVLPSPVLDAVIDRGNVVVLCASKDQLEVLRCRDDGLAFEALAPSVERGEGDARLAVSGDNILISRESDTEGPSCWTGSWSRQEGLTGTHLPCWLDGEPGGALHLAGRDRGVVVRVGDHAATVVDLHQTFGVTPLRLRDVGADQRVHAMMAEPSAFQNRSVLWVACGVGVVRVEEDSKG